MMAVNYRAPIAAARACRRSGSGTGAIVDAGGQGGARGQVPLPVKAMGLRAGEDRSAAGGVFTLGLLYSKEQGMVSQRGDNINMVDPRSCR